MSLCLTVFQCSYLLFGPGSVWPSQPLLAPGLGVFPLQPPAPCSDSPDTPDLSHNQLFWLGKDYSNLITKDWVQLDRPFEGECPFLQNPGELGAGAELRAEMSRVDNATFAVITSFSSVPQVSPGDYP